MVWAPSSEKLPETRNIWASNNISTFRFSPSRRPLESLSHKPSPKACLGWVANRPLFSLPVSSCCPFYLLHYFSSPLLAPAYHATRLLTCLILLPPHWLTIPLIISELRTSLSLLEIRPRHSSSTCVGVSGQRFRAVLGQRCYGYWPILITTLEGADSAVKF